jgi:hypothetical protein
MNFNSKLGSNQDFIPFAVKEFINRSKIAAINFKNVSLSLLDLEKMHE